jgi:hypothetical protein
MTPSHLPRPKPRALWRSPKDVPSGLLLLALLPLFLLTACDFITAEPPLDLTASLEADQLSLVAGQIVRFSAEGTGDRLGALILDFGDGGQQTSEAGGARRASLEVEWVYEEPGTYLAGLEVIEFNGARASAFLEITVTPSAAP